MKGTNIKIAITPPSLLGIKRRIAYANRKYHFGWIYVTKELAKIKLSGLIFGTSVCHHIPRKF